jgi:hypothetical protein
VSTPDPSPVLYRVAYSEHVRDRLRAMLERAVALGIGRRTFDAAREIDHLLRIYPQFGEPLLDLETEGETVWHGTVDLLHVRYVIDEPNRTVFIVAPITPLPHSELAEDG